MIQCFMIDRVGEEREKAKEELERERKEYSLQIQALVDQQKQILVERMGECEGQGGRLVLIYDDGPCFGLR